MDRIRMRILLLVLALLVVVVAAGDGKLRGAPAEQQQHRQAKRQKCRTKKCKKRRRRQKNLLNRQNAKTRPNRPKRPAIDDDSLSPDQFESDPTAPFRVIMPLLTPDVLSGYDGVEGLRGGLENMIKLHLNSVIQNNAEAGGGGTRPIFADDGPFFEFGSGIVADAPMAPDSGGADRNTASDQVGDDTTDFSTNNQERNVDEADVVKADGTHFFAAYGDYLVVWDKKGTLVYSVRMPTIEFPKPDPIYWPFPPPFGGPVFFSDPVEPRVGEADGEEIIDLDVDSAPRGNPDDASDGPQNRRRTTDFLFPGYIAHPSIRSLMLDGTRLVAIVSGYGPAMRARAEIENPVFHDLYSTRIIIFDTSTLAEDPPFLAYVSHRDVNGHYQDGRTINGTGYIVTSTGLNYYHHLDRKINRYQSPFYGMANEEYVQEATTVATDLVDTVAQQIIDELMYDSNLPRLFRLSAFQTKLSGIEGFDSALLAKSDIGKNYIEVIGFDITAGDFDNATMFPRVAVNETDFGDIELNRVGSWLPGFGGDVYATEDFIVFAGRTWNWIPGLSGSLQSTCLLAVRTNNGDLEPAAVGVVNGTILNQFSVDIKDNYMRIATTVDTLWIGRPRVIFTEDGDQVEITVPELDLTSRTQNHLIVLEIPKATGDVNTTGILEELGSVRLGKPNERFTAVRMFDDIGYAVTFLRTDPFYVLDLTDPRNPSEVAELNITGFSSYLHPIDRNNSLLLAVGQEATEDGVAVGVQITLFDASDVGNPVVLQRYVVENSTDQWSSTSAEFDAKAFRYLDLGNNTGRLIIPLTIYGRKREDFFDGFVVYRISTSLIEPHFNVTHRSGRDDLFFSMCYTCAWLRERSFVVEGNLMTMKGHSIVSTDLDTTERDWTLPLVFGDENNCCYW